MSDFLEKNGQDSDEQKGFIPEPAADADMQQEADPPPEAAAPPPQPPRIPPVYNDYNRYSQSGPSYYGSPRPGGQGWQNDGYRYGPSQPPGSNPSQQGDYRWNFNEYDNFAQKQPGKRRKNRGLMVFGVMVGVLLAVGMLVLAGFGAYSLFIGGNQYLPLPPAGQSSSMPQQQVPDEQMPDLDLNDKPADQGPVITAEGRLATSEIARRVGPTVVGVIQYTNTGGQMAMGSGSGIIISGDGYIVTNAHVVGGSTGIEVVLHNGDRYEAWLVGIDTRTDLAVLKIEANGLTYATFGNSDQIEVGETVIAIGNPGGEELAGSVTKGIVSALNRTIKTQADGYSLNCIQTDAAINPGNSGGPLVNEFGQIIGINSAKLVQTEYEGIGFAIPINDAKPIIDDLIKFGRVTGRVRLGITALAIDESYARFARLPAGIRIISTEQGTDIATKGLRIGEQAGDIITHIGGQPVNSFDDIANALRGVKPGEKVNLTIYRVPYNGERSSTFEINVAVVEDTK